MTGVFDSGLLRRGCHANGKDTNAENIRLWPVFLSRTFGEVPVAEKAQDSNHIWNHRNLYGGIDPSGQPSYFRIDIESRDTGQSDAQVFTSILVIGDQTLEDIAGQYADPDYYRNTAAYYREICEINHLPVKEGGIPHVAPGNYIIVPYFSPDFL